MAARTVIHGLGSEIADCRAMCAGKSWATDDPLGTGGLLVDTFRLAQIRAEFDVSAPVELTPLLADCESGLEAFMQSATLGYPAAHRLAFRELGLSLGLHALARLHDLIVRYPSKFSLTECKGLARLTEFSQLSDLIEHFWLQEAHQQVETWRAHPDINSVMLATSLAPDGYLRVSPKRPQT